MALSTVCDFPPEHSLEHQGPPESDGGGAGAGGGGGGGGAFQIMQRHR